MKYSVIIPCYNSSKTIGVALDSLCRQSIKDFEVIIVDDGSEDHTLTKAVIDEFVDSLEIKVLWNKINKNGAFARNRGIEIARGEYIAFLDSDDIWVGNRLQYADEFINKFSDVGDIFIYGKFELLRDHSRGALLPLRGIKSGELVSEYVFAACQLMQTSTFVCSSSLAKQIKFDESLSRHQDSDFAMRVQKKGSKIVFDPRKCSSYIFRTADLSSRVMSGRINSNYCRDWLYLKKQYFTSTSIAGYKLSVYSRILFLEGKKIKSFQMLFESLMSIGFRNLFEFIVTKFYTIYRSRFGL